MVPRSGNVGCVHHSDRDFTVRLDDTPWIMHAPSPSPHVSSALTDRCGMCMYRALAAQLTAQRDGRIQLQRFALQLNLLRRRRRARTRRRRWRRKLLLSLFLHRIALYFYRVRALGLTDERRPRTRRRRPRTCRPRRRLA